MRKKIFGLRDPFPEKNNVSAVVEDRYKSLVDYENLEITAEEKETLIEYEKGVVFHSGKMQEHLLGISENLYKAQQLLADHKGGTFYKWFEGLGLKKDFVYMCLKRYNLYMRYKKEEIMKLPDRVVKEVVKLSDQLEEAKVYEIIEAPKPNEKLKELKLWLAERPLEEEEYIVVDKDALGREKLCKEELLQVKAEIRELQVKLKGLKKREKELEVLIIELENMNAI